VEKCFFYAAPGHRCRLRLRFVARQSHLGMCACVYTRMCVGSVGSNKPASHRVWRIVGSPNAVQLSMSCCLRLPPQCYPARSSGSGCCTCAQCHPNSHAHKGCGAWSNASMLYFMQACSMAGPAHAAPGCEPMHTQACASAGSIKLVEAMEAYVTYYIFCTGALLGYWCCAGPCLSQLAHADALCALANAAFCGGHQLLGSFHRLVQG